MRRRVVLPTVAAIAVALGLVLPSCGANTDKPVTATATRSPTGRGTPILAKRTVRVGKVDITIEPRQLDDTQAVIAITLDTHAVELSMDLASAALDVDGTPWPVTSWVGDGPGGHHRQGELRFAAVKPPKGRVRLLLRGFAEPVDVTWNLAT